MRRMEKKGRLVCAVAVAAAVVTALLRVIVTPHVVDGTAGNGLNILLLVFIAAALLCLMAMGSAKRPPLTLRGGRLTAVTAGALFTGAAMVISSVFALADWWMGGVMPYPINNTVTQLDVTLLYLMVAFGVIGGLFFLLLAFRWQLTGCTARGVLRIVALAPLVWVWLRVGRYEMSYISSLNVFQHVYDLLLIIAEMLFFLWFARYVSDPQEAPPRFLTGVALCTGVLATAACVTRVAMLLMGNRAAFDACGLVTAADLGVAILAFGFGFGQLTAPTEAAAEPVAEIPPPPPPVQVEEDEEEPVFLLDSTGDFITDDEDDDVIPEGERRPLELEDVINDIIRRIENGEK